MKIITESERESEYRRLKWWQDAVSGGSRGFVPAPAITPAISKQNALYAKIARFELNSGRRGEGRMVGGHLYVLDPGAKAYRLVPDKEVKSLRWPGGLN